MRNPPSFPSRGRRRHTTTSSVFLMLLSFLALGAVVVNAQQLQKTCFLLYQMADNNLEYYLNQDYGELTQSSLIQNTNDIRVWIYYDARNSGDDNAGKPLPNTVELNSGNGQAVPLTGTFYGSRYVTYDGSLQSMRVDETLANGAEQNSDTTTTIQNFLEHGMTDCIAGGYTNMMAIFSSHGGGAVGYGGDDNKRRQRARRQLEQRRNLLQYNSGVVTAIENALGSVAGTPPKLEVIGFDACLMQAMGAADDYSKVANYILASEAVEPGHGWAYNFLTDASNGPLGLAQQIVTTYVEQTQSSGSNHQSPKVLAILDTTKFDTFVQAFETFMADLYQGIIVNQDQSLNSFVGRARSSAVAFEGVLDSYGTDNPSALDIGSFLTNLQDLCDPGSSTTLGQSLSSTITAYNDMWVSRKTGPGTSADATGMAINWPMQSEYLNNQYTWDAILFTDPNYVTAIVPNYLKFLKEYLSTTSAPPPSDSDTSNSVCGTSAQSETVDEADKIGLIYSAVAEDTEISFTITAEISPLVTHMAAVYGINMTTVIRTEFAEHIESHGLQTSNDDFLLLANGEVKGTYSGSTFVATWDKRYYQLQSSTLDGRQTRTMVYVVTEKDGSRRSPVLYFPEAARQNATSLVGKDFLNYKPGKWRKYGALRGFLTFSDADIRVDGPEVNKQGGGGDAADRIVHDNLILFASDLVEGEISTGTFSQVPHERGGIIVPLNRVVGSVGGRNITTIPGGKNHDMLDWKPDLPYLMVSKPSHTLFDRNPNIDAVTMGIVAYNRNGADANIGTGGGGDPRPSDKNNMKIYEVILPGGSGKGISDVSVGGPPVTVFESTNYGKTDFSSSSEPIMKIGQLSLMGSLVFAFGTILGW